MERVQETLFNQLKSHDSKLEIQIREKNEALKRVIKNRENVGVELYSVQQQLARLQAVLEGTENSTSTIANYKLEAERNLGLFTKQHQDQSKKLLLHTKNCTFN